MNGEEAIKFMKQCAISSLTDKYQKKGENESATFFPLMELNSLEQVLNCIDFVSQKYKDKIIEGSAKGVGYFLWVDPCNDSHPINILATLYTLLVSDANIYVLYDASYHYHDYTKTHEYFLDMFVKEYDKAEKVTIIPMLTRLEHIAIENFVKSHIDIKHFIQIGDFCNFGDERILKLLKRLNLRIHLPSAHYVILNYKNEEISEQDEGCLRTFGHRCWNGLIDYAAYETDGNKHNAAYGFDILRLFENDLSMFHILDSIRPFADKVITIIFTDLSKEELAYPEEFYECCDVYFSKDFDVNKLNYDFTQLLIKGEKENA